MPVEPEFVQFAKIDAGLLAWHFILEDARAQEIASVERGFRGFGREVSPIHPSTILPIMIPRCGPKSQFVC